MILLGAKEAAKILQLSTARVYELTRLGILPCVRIGPRQVRFEESRLSQWIEFGGSLDAASTDDQIERASNLPRTDEPKASGDRDGSDNSGRRNGSRAISTLLFDELRESEPIHLVIECVVRFG